MYNKIVTKIVPPRCERKETGSSRQEVKNNAYLGIAKNADEGIKQRAARVMQIPQFAVGSHPGTFRERKSVRGSEIGTVNITSQTK
jgi:hypothetical protein